MLSTPITEVLLLPLPWEGPGQGQTLGLRFPLCPPTGTQNPPPLIPAPSGLREGASCLHPEPLQLVLTLLPREVLAIPGLAHRGCSLCREMGPVQAGPAPTAPHQVPTRTSHTPNNNLGP